MIERRVLFHCKLKKESELNSVNFDRYLHDLPMIKEIRFYHHTRHTNYQLRDDIIILLDPANLYHHIPIEKKKKNASDLVKCNSLDLTL